MHEDQSFKRRMKYNKNYYGKVFQTQKDDEEES